MAVAIKDAVFEKVNVKEMPDAFVLKPHHPSCQYAQYDPLNNEEKPVSEGKIFSEVLPYTWRYIFKVIKLRFNIRFKKGFYTGYENTKVSYILQIIRDKIFRKGYPRSHWSEYKEDVCLIEKIMIKAGKRWS